mgnify:CR=1 FL=1
MLVRLPAQWACLPCLARDPTLAWIGLHARWRRRRLCLPCLLPTPPCLQAAAAAALVACAASDPPDACLKWHAQR